MKGKLLISFIIILTLFLSVSLVCASENVSDFSTIIDSLDESVDLDNGYEPQILQDSHSDGADKSQTNITASNITTYSDIEETFTVKLTSNGTGLAEKQIKIVLNNVTYENVTDLNGEVGLKFKLNPGTYSVFYSFLGDGTYAASNGTSTITVKEDIATCLSVVNGNAKYVADSNSVFQLKLTDINGTAIAGLNVTVQVGGKTYVATTDSNGIATFYLKLKQGTYTIQYSFPKTGHYLASSGTFKITVKAKLTGGYGYWVNKWDMPRVNLKKLADRGTKHIFLLHTAFSKYGKSKVVKWIKKAHKYGMKVHIWMAVFYKNGKFIHPVSKKGKFNYRYMNKMIKRARYYASIDVVDGIHFDYLRFGGNAYKYKRAVKAVNYFVKKACKSVRKVNPDIIVSAAVMPEPTSMKHYYAQDIKTISKYLDVIVPMVYKGNYHASYKWIKSTTNRFVKMSKGAKIWTGIQSYKSDAHVKKLSYKALFRDAKYAVKGKAAGVVIFRWGLSPLINFNKL